jgi:hypothetical protein
MMSTQLQKWCCNCFVVDLLRQSYLLSFEPFGIFNDMVGENITNNVMDKIKLPVVCYGAKPKPF